MTNLWHWIALNSGPLGIGTCFGGAFTIFLWFFPNRKEWKVERQAKANLKTDSRVHEALGNRSIWKGSRGMSGAGFYAVRSDEIAEYLKLDPEAVNESLERLRTKGRANKEKGTLDDARPIWIYLPR
jgi:hypothetical protein